MAHRTTPRRWLAHLLALVLYLLGSLLATWPLPAHFTTHVTGDGIDDPALAWNLWWVKFRLVDQLQPDIFHVGWMFHPIEINLGFYTLTPLNGLLSVPLQTATTVLVANNLMLLTSFVLGGYGVWLLAQDVWASHLSHIDRRIGWAIAWLAGAFYAFAGAKLFYASLGQFNIASSHWLPFCVLYVWRTLHSKSAPDAWRNGILAGLFLVFQAWSELTYATFLLLFFGLTYVYFSISWLVSSQSRRWWQMTQGMIAAALVFALGISPFLIAILPDMRLEGDFFTTGGGFADIFSADLMGFLLPTRLHPALGEWVAQLPFPNDKGQQIFLGYTVMLLVIFGAIAGLRNHGERAKTAFWLLALLGFFLLTLGPLVRWAGINLPIPGPFALVNQLPFFNGNRYPSRYSVMLFLCASILAANGLLWLSLQPWLRGKRLAVALVIVGIAFTAEHISTPLPLNDFRIPPIYRRLAAEPGDFTVLELPTGWRNGARVLGKSDVLIMMQEWYQTAYGKHRLGGNTSRNPAYKFQYFSETPLLADLIALMNADRSHIAPVAAEEYPAIAETARKTAAELFKLLGVRYVTLHVEHSPALLVQLVEEALPVTLLDEWQGPDWTGVPSTIRLYEVDDAADPTQLSIDLATPDAQMYLAEGWSPLGDPQQGRFATRQTVDLLLPAWAEGEQVTLTYAQPNTVNYSYQGTDLGKQTGITHTLTLPRLTDDVATTRLTLTFDSAPTSVAEIVPSATPIGSTGASLDPGVAILVQSAGEEVGDFAHIWVNGVDYAENERGYNLVALTPAGEILGRASIDTMLEGESARMVEWLDGWQAGTIIAGAGADTVEGPDSNPALSEEVIAALQRLGVANDLRGKFRWSHAFVGVAGAPSASAVEEAHLIHPAALWLGAPLPSPSGYGPLLNVTISDTAD